MIYDCDAGFIANFNQIHHSHCSCTADHRVDCSADSGSGSKPSISTLSTKQQFQLDLMGGIMNSFVDMLLNNSSKANEQKQKMMQELQQQQALAAAQAQAAQDAALKKQKEEEARKLAAMCDRLQEELMLSGAPQLHMMLSGPPPGQGLKLMLGSDSSGQAGIQGLPGIYLNGPATPPTPPVGNASGNGGGAMDAINMSPQQLAELAKQWNSLTPEEQQQFMDKAHTQSQVSQTTPSAPTTQPGNGSDSVSQHAQAGAASQAAPGQASQGAGPASTPPQTSSAGTTPTALGQLQQTAASGQAATLAGTPEGMAAGAQSGFDTPGGAVISGHTSGQAQASTAAAKNESSSAVPPKASNASASTSAPAKADAAPAVALSLGMGSSGMAGIAAGEPILTASEALATQAPSRIARMSNEQLKTETCKARAMLDQIGKISQQQTQAFEKETENEVLEMKKEAFKAGAKCFTNMFEKLLDDNMDQMLENSKEQIAKSMGLKEEWLEKLNKIYGLTKEVVKSNGEYLEEKDLQKDATQEEATLTLALGYLNGLYESVRKTPPAPWVDGLQCSIDFAYSGARIYLAEEEMKMRGRNLDDKAGALNAERSVAAFHKKLVDESLSRGLDPKTFCH